MERTATAVVTPPAVAIDIIASQRGSRPSPGQSEYLPGRFLLVLLCFLTYVSNLMWTTATLEVTWLMMAEKEGTERKGVREENGGGGGGEEEEGMGVEEKKMMVKKNS
ncbi:hypothetical protein LSTR_LSTR002321 [Laodelphax striatellus]|uniref:Uncharacterized protein n=1 Tax=Laodelphax striatellus TaxID=195883 RepID=A0A482X308_LAOST|nr:hypothetical protein LSTR_LSTR002321 [Laodelphax striatellus]